jgi:glycosyltransferase involved in cell wall biosynthesis
MKLNSPNKFFDALASGKMVITNTKGWIHDLVKENDCGFYLDPENPQDFISMIKPFLVKSQLLKQQDNARKLAEKSFDKDKRIKELLNFLTT